MRNRAGVVIYCKQENKIVLIYRYKNNKSYWVIPGGGVHAYETFETAAKREVLEELNLTLNNMIEFHSVLGEGNLEKYYLTLYPDTESLTIGGEEQEICSDINYYNPEWINVHDLKELDIVPLEMKNKLIKYFSLYEDK
ncbi:MAG: NUDIX domain-containing protein [Turicibacter sp.]